MGSVCARVRVCVCVHVRACACVLHVDDLDAHMCVCVCVSVRVCMYVGERMILVLKRLCK